MAGRGDLMILSAVFTSVCSAFLSAAERLPCQTERLLLVGGPFDLEMNFIIQEAQSIGCMVELLNKCDPTCQAEVWSIFTAILKKSVRNLQACTEVGLIQQVLDCVDRTDSMIADLMVDMLGVLASYSITVKELKLFFSKLQGAKGQWPPHAVKLLSVLKSMAHRVGPDSFFSFPGKSAAAIALPPIAKWPYQNGFTFHTWLRVDPLNNINVDKDKPYLYCFRTSKGLGYSAHFVGGCLIITSLKSKGKGFQHCVKYDFKPQKWYMVTIVHVYNRWKNSEISCYVNGELASYGEITWFVNTSDTFDKCFLGSSETADANRVFCGQMGAVYLFNEALSAAQILAIYQLGPGYKGTFKYKAESDLLFAEHHKMLLYDGKLSSSIAFTYNPRATDAQLCLESSPKDNASIFVHSPHALMLQDVKAVVTHSVQSAIHSIGGVQVLFPLFAQLDFLQPSSDELDSSICCTLLSFVMELLKNSVAMQEQVLACKGFLVIGYTLEKSSKLHVTRPVLDILLTFARYLSNLPNGVPLLKQLCDHILFNPTIWIHAPAKVQLTLYTYLATEFISTVTIYNAIRRVGTVLQVMHTLKYFYWVVNPQDRSGVTPKGVDGPRPNPKEIHSLRAFLLLFVKQLIMKDYGVKEDELQSILNYLLTMHEDENLMDVLQLLVALMSEHPSSMVLAFDQRNGIRVIYKLLASKSEGIRVQALKVLGYFLKHLPPKRKSEVMLSHGLFSLLTERLMLHSNQFTLTTYNVLFEILTEQICTQVIHKQHPDPDSSVKIQNPQILKVIAALLKNSPPGPESMEVRRIFLSDMIKLFNNSRDNRRSLLQCSVWQDWMLSLCYINPKNSEEQKITEMVYAIFRILLYHAIKYEWGGWRVWVDTLSITHSKVTFEQHKENLARMFREYQRLGSDPGSGTEIRTVSGASQDAELLNHASGEMMEPPVQEETAPSTVIELCVDDGPPSLPNRAEKEERDWKKAKNETSEGEENEERSHTSVAVSNIILRAEEEEKEEGECIDQQQDYHTCENQARQEESQCEASTSDGEVLKNDTGAPDNHETASTELELKPKKQADAGPEVGTESGDVQKAEEVGEEGETAKACESKIEGAKVEDTNDVKWTAGEGDVQKESEVDEEKRSQNEDSDSREMIKETTTDQMSEDSVEQGGSEVCNYNETSTAGASIINEDLVDVSSVSDAVKASDDSMEESSFVSASATMGDGDKEHEDEEQSRATQSDARQPDTQTDSAIMNDKDGVTENNDRSIEYEGVWKDLVDTKEALPTRVSTEGPELETVTSEGPMAESMKLEEPKVEPVKSEESTAEPVTLEEPTAETVTSEEHSLEKGQACAEATEEGNSSDAQKAAAESGKEQVEGTAAKTKEVKIARLDVSSVATDTERLELKEATSSEGSQAQATASGPAPASRDSTSSSARSTMFRIPEFKWSHMHQRLLTDLLFSIETDVQMWRSHSTKTVMDFVNSSENVVFVHNTVHLISQVVDNLIMACGGILPLLSAATSSSHELESIEPSQGLAVEASVTFLQRLISLVDVLIFASSLSFTEIEAEKNMSSGGILRQCLRLVCAMAVRNCLECQQHSQSGLDSGRGHKSLMGAAKSKPAQAMDMVTGGMSPIRDIDRLLQDMDINRLRAVVFRDIEDSKQAQFLALAVVYFISVLMVSKYRDILEPQNDKRPVQHSQSTKSTESLSSGLDLESTVLLRRRDSGIGDEQTSMTPSESAAASSQGPDAISEALSTLSLEVRKGQEGAGERETKGKNVNVKDILRSLVSAPADDIMVDPSLLPPTFLGAVGGDGGRDQALQFHSFDRSVVVAPKKVGGAPCPASVSGTVANPPASAAGGTPTNNVAVVSSSDTPQTASADSATADPGSTNLPSVPALSPASQHTTPSMSISERLEHALEKAAPLLREIFVDFAPFLSRTLLGSHGQELLIEGTSLVCMKSSSSVVELVMLLCSQEWQNSIQKNAGLAFIELVNEGRLLSHTMKDHLVRVANEAEFILSRQRAEDIHKHAEFESHCAQYAAEKRDEEKMCDHLIRAAKYRDHVTATQLIQKIVNILTDKHGAWGSSSVSHPGHPSPHPLAVVVCLGMWGWAGPAPVLKLERDAWLLDRDESHYCITSPLQTKHKAPCIYVSKQATAGMEQKNMP
ncbi:hypothetical protein ACEWY4_007492 [Coilia grayii]|uniref:Lipopolysaccharide-responsive and beige-like anchor protein n=1 Tax=Coilia grayii TaxID=363190 RepID=A0ABD1KGR1_9TELE